MTLGQLCDRYFLKKPNIMSFDIEGLDYSVFEKNNWTNPKCYPEVIINQNNPWLKQVEEKPVS